MGFVAKAGRPLSGQALVASAIMVALCALPAVVFAQSRAVAPAPLGGAGSSIALGAPAASAPAAAPAIAPAPPNDPAPGRSMPPAPKNGGRSAPLPNPKIDLVNEVVLGAAPMTPAEIARAKELLDQRTRAMVENPVSAGPVAKPTQSVYQIDLAPKGQYTPPVVRVMPGQGSVVTFVDLAGKPWPIEVADNAGDERGIKVQQFRSHQLSIFASANYAGGNVLVGLKGLEVPVTFSTVSGQKAVDYAVTMVIPRLQPGSAPTMAGADERVPSLASSDLFDYLLGTPPAKAVALKVTGIRDTQAWQVGPDKLVVRTPALLSAATRSFKLDDMGVYEVPMMPVILGTLDGRYVQATISLR